MRLPNRACVAAAALALCFALVASCTNHDQITASVCSATETASQPCSSVGATCVNPGLDPPMCTCTHSGWSCPVHRDAALRDAEAGADDGDDADDAAEEDDTPTLILNFGDAEVTEDATADATSDVAQGDAVGDGE